MTNVLAITLNPAIDLTIGLDDLTPGRMHRARNEHMRAAGKGHNVASVLAGLGHRVTVAGFIGAANSAIFEAAFAADGIVDACTRVAGETRINVKLAEGDGRVTDINAPGPSITAGDWQRLQTDLEGLLAAGPDAVVIAGSLPPGVETAAFGLLVAYIEARGLPVWLDTSAAALASGLRGKPTLVKPNIDELTAWAGAAPADEAGLVASARAMQQAGVGEVVVSRGPAGALWLTPESIRIAQAPEVAVYSAVCAGDTLLAGLLHGRLSGWGDDETFGFAAAIATDAVMREGVGRADGPGFAALRAGVHVAPYIEAGPAPAQEA